MSELRRQLDSAHDAYRSQRYPGDLAAELMTRRVSAAPARGDHHSKGMRLVVAGSLITGLAAAVMLWIGTRPDAANLRRGASPVVVVTTTQQLPQTTVAESATAGSAVAEPADESAPLPTELSAFPSFPDDVPLMPSIDASDAMELGSMPGMPSLDFSFADPATSKEST